MLASLRLMVKTGLPEARNGTGRQMEKMDALALRKLRRRFDFLP
jgi:hypothetical protein